MRMSDYQKKGWKIERTSTNYNIFTPEGDVFSYDDLITGNCPICSQLDESIAPEFCDMTEEEHDKKLINRIEEARNLATLIMNNAIRNLS